MKIPKKGFKRWIVLPLHIATAGMLVLLGIVFVYLIFLTFIKMMIAFADGQMTINNMLERSFLIFLLIEVVASIKIYFSENYHFPLRFFVYIGITDMIRQIIIEREHPEYVLQHAIALIILVVALTILEIKNYWILHHKNDEDEHAEL